MKIDRKAKLHMDLVEDGGSYHEVRQFGAEVRKKTDLLGWGCSSRTGKECMEGEV
jgi:hypothetical protein